MSQEWESTTAIAAQHVNALTRHRMGPVVMMIPRFGLTAMLTFALMANNNSAQMMMDLATISEIGETPTIGAIQQYGSPLDAMNVAKLLYPLLLE